ncbi:hypothetical protein V1478_008688 [Vespula squamosa]|uniref:Uncharacterized protein n=1 Tax=Vespula squamosa TaxID=30214 RepID=A0ABD2AWX7_VESSQ
MRFVTISRGNLLSSLSANLTGTKDLDSGKRLSDQYNERVENISVDFPPLPCARCRSCHEQEEATGTLPQTLRTQRSNEIRFPMSEFKITSVRVSPTKQPTEHYLADLLA